MSGFSTDHFKATKFSTEQISGYLAKALRDLEIAEKDQIPDVRFAFAYQALVKAGIAHIAHEGYKVRATPGHHIKLIEKLSELLNDPNVFTFGNTMRMKRNDDLYGDGSIVSAKDADEYLEFVRSVLVKVKARLK